MPSPQGNGSIKGYLVAAGEYGKIPAVLVIHENRGLNPVHRGCRARLAVADFIAFAPDGLTSVGGYPGDDEKGCGALPAGRSRQDDRGFSGGGRLAQIAPGLYRQARRCWLLLRRRRRQHIGGADGLRSERRRAVLRNSASAADAAKIKAPIIAQYGELDTRITGGWPAFDAALTAAHVPHEGHVTKAPITASTTTRPPVTTKPRPKKRGSARSIG